MKNEFDFLKRNWEDAKKASPAPNSNVNSLIEQAGTKKKAGIYFQYGNMTVLITLAILIAIYFLWLYPFNTLLSKAGIILMLAGLLVRIAAEYQSTRKAKKIDITDSLSDSSVSWRNYLLYRKTIHGAVTQLTIGLYTIGFFMLFPEFYKYFGIKIVFFLAIFYIIMAYALVRAIRPNVKKELRDLEEIIALRKELLTVE